MYRWFQINGVNVIVLVVSFVISIYLNYVVLIKWTSFYGPISTLYLLPIFFSTVGIASFIAGITIFLIGYLQDKTRGKVE